LIYLVNSYDLLSEFRLTSLEMLESHLNSIAPSICEYHFENISLYSQTQTYLNKNQIEKELFFGDYKLYIDYEENIYLEKDDSYDDSTQDDTLQLW
jgi:hypothetical protein